MVDDVPRTTLFAEAIRDALRRRPGAVVLDIGTGPEALLALIAARAGAKKVYAVEMQPEVAELARQAVAAATDVPAGLIEVHEGFSTTLELPELADLLVAEIVGSVASGEGIYATMHDAQQRLMRRPFEADSYIPRAVETWCAPMSYAQQHPLLGPRDFDWEAVRAEIGAKGPPRFACDSHAVSAMAEPQRLETIRFDAPLPPPGTRLSVRLDFELSGERMAATEAECVAELTQKGMKEAYVGKVAAEVATSLTGVGMWPRLLLDDTRVVDSRGADGAPRESHWQTVLPLMSAVPVMDPVAPGERFALDAAIWIGDAIDDPVRYELALSRVAKD